MGDKQNDLVHQVKVLDIRSQIKRGLWSDAGFGTENQERAKLAREAKDPNSITETAIEEVAKYIAQEQKRLQDAHESVRLKDFNELADKWLLLLEDDNFVYANNMRKIIKETQDKLITLSTEMKGSTKEGAERFYKKVAEPKTSDSNDLPALNVIVDDDSMGKDRYVDVKTQLNVRNKDKKVTAALDRWTAIKMLGKHTTFEINGENLKFVLIGANGVEGFVAEKYLSEKEIEVKKPDSTKTGVVGLEKSEKSEKAEGDDKTVNKNSTDTSNKEGEKKDPLGDLVNSVPGEPSTASSSPAWVEKQHSKPKTETIDIDGKQLPFTSIEIDKTGRLWIVGPKGERTERKFSALSRLSEWEIAKTNERIKKVAPLVEDVFMFFNAVAEHATRSEWKSAKDWVNMPVRFNEYLKKVDFSSEETAKTQIIDFVTNLFPGKVTGSVHEDALYIFSLKNSDEMRKKKLYERLRGSIGITRDSAGWKWGSEMVFARASRDFLASKSYPNDLFSKITSDILDKRTVTPENADILNDAFGASEISKFVTAIESANNDLKKAYASNEAQKLRETAKKPDGTLMNEKEWNDFIDASRRNKLIRIVQERTLKAYAGEKTKDRRSDANLDLIGNILGADTLEMSDNTAKYIRNELWKDVAIELAAIGAGALTAGVGAAGVHALTAARWANRAMEASRAARIGAGAVDIAVTGAAFELGHGAVRSVSKGQLDYSVGSFMQSIAFAGAFKAAAGALRVFKIEFDPTKTLASQKWVLAGLMTADAIASLGVAYGMSIYHDEPITVEQWLQAVAMAILFRGATSIGQRAVRISIDRNGNTRLEWDIPNTPRGPVEAPQQPNPRRAQPAPAGDNARPQPETRPTSAWQERQVNPTNIDKKAAKTLVESFEKDGDTMKIGERTITKRGSEFEVKQGENTSVYNAKDFQNWAVRNITTEQVIASRVEAVSNTIAARFENSSSFRRNNSDYRIKQNDAKNGVIIEKKGTDGGWVKLTQEQITREFSSSEDALFILNKLHPESSKFVEQFISNPFENISSKLKLKKVKDVFSPEVLKKLWKWVWNQSIGEFLQSMKNTWIRSPQWLLDVVLKRIPQSLAQIILGSRVGKDGTMSFMKWNMRNKEGELVGSFLNPKLIATTAVFTAVELNIHRDSDRDILINEFCADFASVNLLGWLGAAFIEFTQYRDVPAEVVSTTMFGTNKRVSNYWNKVFHPEVPEEE